jgi:organic radical activating enzyme
MMPARYMRMRVSEIFWSVQGEGCRCGQPSIFLRLAGCSMSCPYCDTKESWSEGQEMAIADIATDIDNLKKRYPDSVLIISGGEPLEQDLTDLTGKLKERNYTIAVETNGLHFQELPVDWWTVSPKEKSGYFIHEQLRGIVDEIKLVVTPDLNVEKIRQIRERRPDCPIFLQPNFFDRNKYQRTFSLFRQCQQAAIPHLRLGLQLHRIYAIK